MLVKVTQEYIDKGCPQSSKYCPVALAVSDLVKDRVWITVGLYSIVLGNNDLGGVTLFHCERSKIIRFDVKRKMNPFEFDLEIPKDYLKEKVQIDSPVA